MSFEVCNTRYKRKYSLKLTGTLSCILNRTKLFNSQAIKCHKCPKVLHVITQVIKNLLAWKSSSGTGDGQNETRIVKKEKTARPSACVH